jgi:hypothetical protein
MRIRTVKPEFWTSEDIASIEDWGERLLFIGLWSYVDDNGVGRDVEKLIMADLFPLEDDPRETLARVSDGLRTLAERGLVMRYEVDGKRYLYINGWHHQKIDHPSKGGCYPLPTSENASPRPPEPPLSRESRETLAPVPGEQGNRGKGTEAPSPEPAALALVTADAATVRAPRSAFDDFWEHYPRKVGKDDARKAWDKAVKVKKVDAARIVEGAQRFAADPNLPEKQFIPHPSTWLARGGWDDEPCPPRNPQPSGPATANQPPRGGGAWNNRVVLPAPDDAAGVA